MFKSYWEIISSELASADQNMEQDYQRLATLSSTSNPILHFYKWERPSLTYGYFSDPNKFIHRQCVDMLNWDIARRPTGGGVILHAYDLAFAVIVPAAHSGFSLNTLKNYAYVHEKVSHAIFQMIGHQPELFKDECCKKTYPTFCMAQTSQYDLLLQGQKVVGSAQRKTKQGFLHQGSICLTLPPHSILKDLLKDNEHVEEMEKKSFPLADYLGLSVDQARARLKILLIEAFLNNAVGNHEVAGSNCGVI